VVDFIDIWDIVTLCFITPCKEVYLNWQNFIGYRYSWSIIRTLQTEPQYQCYKYLS